MSSVSSASFMPEGDAVRPDGTLKDASEMTWNYDADESIPFPSGSTSVAPLPSSGSHAPATMVAGVRRTTRVSKPSRRVLEAAEASNALLSQRLAAKRKAPSDSLQRRVSRKIVINVDDEGADTSSGDEDASAEGEDVVSEDEDAATNADIDDASDGGTTTEPGTSDDYEALKAMADADNLVCFPPFSRIAFSLIPQAMTFKTQKERTADVRIIFRRDKEYTHPDTGKILDGNWCLVCR